MQYLINLLITLLLTLTFAFTAQAQGTRCSGATLGYSGPHARNLWLGSTLPEGILHDVTKLQQRMRELDLPPGHFEGLNRLHVTLKFIGKMSPKPEPVQDLIKALKNVPLIPLDMKIAKLGVLKNSDGTPRLIWAEVSSHAMHFMFQSIETALESFCDREARGYKPHITLYHFATTKDKKPLDEALAKKIQNLNIDIPRFEVTGFKLIETPKSSRDPWIVLQHFWKKIEWQQSPLFKPKAKDAIPLFEPGQKTPELTPEAPRVVAPQSLMQELKDYVSKYEPSNCNCTELDLSGSNDIVKTALGKTLQKNQNIESLNLSDSKLSGESIAELLKLVPAQNMKVLDLSNNGLGDQGAEALVEVLGEQTNLNSLKLGSNNIGYRGFIAIFNALKHSKANVELDINHNSFDVTTINAISDLLPETNITSLSLWDSGINDSIIKALARLIPKTNITKLDLYLNNISDIGVQELMKVLPNSKITDVLLENNYDIKNHQVIKDFMKQYPLITISAHNI